MSRIVLAYSGGLDTSVLLKKLILEGTRGHRDDGRSRRERRGRRERRPRGLGGGARKGLEPRRVRSGAARRARAFHLRVRVCRAARQRALSGRLSALRGAFAPADRRTARARLPTSTARRRWRTAAPAKATTKCASSSACARSIQRWLAVRRCASRRSRVPMQSPTRKSTAFRSRTRSRSPIRSTPISGDARSKPACSKIRGTRRRKTRTPGQFAGGGAAGSGGDPRLVRCGRAEPQRRARGGDGRAAQSRLPARTASAGSI